MKTKYKGMHENHLEPKCTQRINLTRIILVLMGLHVSKPSHSKSFDFLVKT